MSEAKFAVGDKLKLLSDIEMSDISKINIIKSEIDTKFDTKFFVKKDDEDLSDAVLFVKSYNKLKNKILTVSEVIKVKSVKKKEEKITFYTFSEDKDGFMIPEWTLKSAF